MAEQNSFVLVTGAAGGLGKAFAVECASRGWDVYLSDLNPAPLESLADSLRSAYGVQVLVRPCDLADASTRAAWFEELRRSGLSFWGLVNVAGIDYEGLFCEQARARIRTIVRLNVEGTLEVTHALLELRDPRTTFRIINVASLAAFFPMPVKATYAASKRFLLDFSLALGEEVRGLGATVTVLCPAGMPTTTECVEAIEAQGWAGYLTTMDVGRVANETLNCALRGQALVIPGWVNRLVMALGSLAPTGLVVSLIGSRWKAARQKRGLMQAPV